MTIDFSEELERITAEYEADKNKFTLHDYSDLADALKKIRNQYLAGEPLTWTGPTSLHHSISATCPGPDWYFSKEGQAYEADRGRDFWDTYTLVSFHLGFHQGTVQESQTTAQYKRILAISNLSKTL